MDGEGAMPTINPGFCAMDNNFKIYVQGLPWKVTEDDVRAHFGICGQISNVELGSCGGKSFDSPAVFLCLLVIVYH